MKKIAIFCMVSLIALSFGLGNALAQQPSSKATAKVGDLTGIVTGDEFEPIFTQYIKTNTGGDLFIDVSLECGITTNTAVMSKQLERAISTAEAAVMVKVVIDDDNVAAPGTITFASRKQTLVAEFAGDFSECMELVPVYDIDGYMIGGTISVDSDCTQAEFLELILKSMNANSFNFVANDLFAGTHKVQVFAKLIYTGDDGAEVPIDRPEFDVDPGSWAQSASYAWLGNGSVTIEKVRMIKDEDFLLE